jgi:hypothetical protein
VGILPSMQFKVSRPDAIRAINQRWLFKFWQQHLEADRVPRWQTVKPDGLSHHSANLSLLDVTEGEGGLRFQIRFHGETVGQVFGSSDCRGRYLHESTPEPARAKALAPYRETVASGRPVYTVQDLVDCQGRLVHYERLLLPFSRDGEKVDRILTSFEFFCPDGGFDGTALLSAPNGAPALRLAATIGP